MIGWAVIGTSRHTDTRIGPAIRDSKRSRLVAIVSRDVSRAQDFALRHNVKHCSTSLREALNFPEVNAVYVASPNYLHTEHTIEALDAGKHVLCEKPMALKIEDCTAMIEAAERAGVCLGVGYQWRHHPAHRKARELISSGSVGEVVWAQAFRGASPRPEPTGWAADPNKAGAGTLMATGVHLIDLVRFTIGDEVDQVSALSDAHTQPLVLDSTFALLFRFRRGAIAQVTSTRLAPSPRNDLILLGDKGSVIGRETISIPASGSLEIDVQGRRELLSYTHSNPYVDLIDDFVSALIEGRTPNPSGIDGLAVAEITAAALKSATDGSTVTVPHPRVI